jgi:hypothetical protein
MPICTTRNKSKVRLVFGARVVQGNHRPKEHSQRMRTHKWRLRDCHIAGHVCRRATHWPCIRAPGNVPHFDQLRAWPKAPHTTLALQATWARQLAPLQGVTQQPPRKEAVCQVHPAGPQPRRRDRCKQAVPTKQTQVMHPPCWLSPTRVRHHDTQRSRAHTRHILHTLVTAADMPCSGMRVRPAPIEW